ncbi:Ig-like domain-containing protein [Achromobacter pestifer]|uniref:Ig-like domain-containing protein n=1 Tax=Achromobacter pestifer TaxID=1353889 RepID=A0A7D4ICZ3_9BURK|nr:Ig-like domain-containing protein [Achromobacter pestifer]QKH39201.1 Ig-like domain-containing protein [Achromobacter pestifer]
MALSVFLLFQGCAAPLAGEHRKPSAAADVHAASATVAVLEGGRTQEAVAARPAIPGGMDPAPDLEGRPLPANPDQMASGDARAMAGGKATGEAKRLAEGWLGQFGTARLDLLGSFHGGALDMLFPVRDSGTGLLFSQLGARRTNLLQESYRTTVNLGLGYRHFADGYMVGGNAFLDQDVSRGHRRLGLGGEWWADYLKLSMNGYFRLSDWKRSPDARDYQERPASGWDIRTEGYLPQYPQLGGKLMFEKYYGDEVGLFGASNRQRNPSAWTLGVSYTPAPVVTLGLDHRMGQGGKSDTSFKLGVKYAIGVPLAKQLEPGSVASSRQLAGMRMDLVERNNEIVLEYKKNAPMTIQLPSAVSGYPQAVLSFPVTIVGAGAAPAIEWSGSAAAFAARYGGGSGAITLPAYNIGGVNTYRLTATAIDAHGRKISSNIMEVSVNPLSLSVARSKAAAMADGIDSVRFTAQVRGVEAEPMAGRAIAWALRGPGAIKESSDRTDADGQAFVMVSSTVAAMVEVEATEAQGFKGRSEAEFLAAPASANVAQLDATPASILANGRDKAVLKATVKDGKGNAVGAGVAVNWTATGGQLSSNSSNTDASGMAVAELLAATAPGTAVITAKAGAEDPGKTRSVDFLLDASDAKVVLLTPSKTSALANGIDTVTFTATVADGRGNPVGAGIAVHWGASLGTLGAASGSTDANSQATIVLTAPTAAGVATVSARSASGDAGKTAAIAFGADASSARVVLLTPSEASGVANGTATVVFTATVEDGRGNPLGAGITVNWSANLGVIASTSITNASSQAMVMLTAPLVPGMATITAKAAEGDAGKTASVVFAANVLMARVAQLTPSKTSGLANGADTVTLTATVDDGRGNPVGAGVAVNWTTDRGTIAAASVTNASSQATAVLTAPTMIGPATVTAKCAPVRQGRGLGSDPGKTAAIAFTADSSSAHVVELSPSKPVGLANGTDTVTLKALVADAQGNPVGAGVAVNWSASLGAIAATSVTNGKSETSVVLTAPTAAGVAAIVAKAAGGDAGKTASVTFSADASSARVIALTPSKTAGVADGRDTVTFMATVADAAGNPVGAGVAVNWGSTMGTLAGATSATNASSQATIVLTAPTAVGAAKVTAKGASGDAGKAASVVFTADASSAHVIELGPSKPVGLANGTDTVTLMASVADAQGNPVGAGVTVNWSASLGTLAATSVTNGKSETSVVLTAPTAAGVAAIVAKAAGGDAGKTVSVTFTADASTARVIALTPSKTAGVADGRDTVTFMATVADAAGNPVGAGVAVSWSASLGTLAGATSATNASSQATIVLTAPTAVGAAKVTAKGASADAGKTVSVAFTADASSAHVLELSPSKPVGLANGTDTVTLMASVADAQGNPVGAGVTVNWSASLGTIAATSVTNGKSETSVVLTAPTSAGVAAIVAKAAGGDAGQTTSVSFTADASTARVVALTPSKTAGVANGWDTVTFTATVADAGGNPVGASVAVSWGASLGTLAGVTSTTNASSQATVVLTAPTAAAVTVVTAKAASGDAGKSASVTFAANVIDGYVYSIEPSKKTAVANGVDTVTYTANVQDFRGKPVGAGIDIHWTTNNGTLANAVSVTDANSRATVVLTTSTKAGLVTVRAKGSAGDGRTVDITFLADHSTARVVEVVSPMGTVHVIGYQPPLIAAVHDANGNPVGEGVKVNWSTDFGSMAWVERETAFGGKCSSSLNPVRDKAGVATVTARVVGTADPGKSIILTFQRDGSKDAVLKVLSSKDVGMADGKDVVTLRADVRDWWGDRVGAGITVNWTTTGGTLAAPTSTTGANSEAVIVLTAPDKAGAVSVTAMAAKSTKDPGKTVTLNFTGGGSSPRVGNFSASKTSILADDRDTATFTAVVLDGNGNLGGAGHVVNWGTDLGTLDTSASTTNGNGEATAVLRGPVAGLASVTAKAGAGDPGRTVRVTLTADPLSARVATLAANRSKALANGSDTLILTALVADARGNPVGAGVTVNWSASQGTLAATSVTNGKSETSVVLTAPTAAGMATIVAKAASGDAGKTVSATFTADLSTARVVSFVPMRTTSTTFPAGVGVNVRATVQDAYGNPVGAGVTITWSSDSATLDLATSRTSQDSTATNTVTYYSAGTVLVKAHAVADDPGKTLAMNYVADSSRDYVTTLNASQSTGVADGSGTVTFTAAVRNQFNDPVGAGVTVHWTTTGGTLAAPTSMTNAAGVANIVLTAPTVAGEVLVSAKAGANDQNNNFAVVTFKNGASSHRVGSSSASKTRVVANGRDSVIFTAMVVDGNGNPGGEGHTVNWSTDLGTLDGATSKTNASGAATAVLTAGTAAGPASVTAKVGAGDAGATVRVTLMADPSSPRVTSLTASKTSGRADGTDTLTLTATVKDVNGNLEDEGIVVNWKTDRGALAAATSSTNASGVAKVELRAPSSPGTAVLSARTVAADPGKTVRVKFESNTINPPPP